MTRALKSFEYFEPRTVEEATQILSRYRAKAKVLAGGCDLIPSMGRREIKPKCVVNLGNIPGLDYIRGNTQELRIGALTRIRSVELSPTVQNGYPVLYEALRSILKIQVKNTGTFVGNICVASPASDIAPALLVLGARLKIANNGSEREIGIDRFFKGVKRSSLRPDEIVKEVIVPKPPRDGGGCFLKLARTSADIAKVNVAVMLRLSKGTCREVKIALASVAPTPMRATRAEDILRGQKFDEEAIERAANAAAKEVNPISDVRSTTEYRRETSRVLVKRAIIKAVERAKA